MLGNVRVPADYDKINLNCNVPIIYKVPTDN